ncbi:unnamed protein product [Rotaria magnacalcarata]|uniref:Transposase n=1 Tax=Rotaria magnacalcarata TaxID=392030 RepID=A0A816MNG6_9BILA|nr:unnamed protein product [Rotaria magnacalcarata]CAF3873252.1 unnamed protein product [Rotaria magnacalcarata]
MSLTRTTKKRVAMVVRLFSKFENAHEVQRKWKHHFDTPPPALSTISAVNQRFEETGSVEDLQRSGRPVTTLTADKLEEIEEMVTTSPNLSVRQGSVQAGISKSSYHDAMNILHLKPYHPSLIVNLNEDDFDRRNQFCEMWLEKFNNDPNLIDHVFWSDEAKFNRNGVVNRHNCMYWSSENPHIKFEVPNTKQGVMVWCGLTSSGLLGPYFFKETATGSVYKQMLIDYAWPYLKHKRLYFQPDGAGPHYAIVVCDWLDEKFPGRWIGRRGPFDWPARSPDLTPCDFFLWGYLKDIVFREPSATIAQLQNKIEQAYAQVTYKMCEEACHSVVHRLRDCLDNEGQFLSY